MFVDKAIADRSKDYMNARRVAKEFEAITRGLNRNAPAIPPQSSIEELRQVDLWKKYIEWEKSNPLKSEELTLVIKRGMLFLNISSEFNFVCLYSCVCIWAMSSLPGAPSRYLVWICFIFGGKQQIDGWERRYEPSQGSTRRCRFGLWTSHFHTSKRECFIAFFICRFWRGIFPLWFAK